MNEEQQNDAPVEEAVEATAPVAEGQVDAPAEESADAEEKVAE